MSCESKENDKHGRGVGKGGRDSGVQSGWPLFPTRCLERSWMLQVGASSERVFNTRVLWSGFYSEGGRSRMGGKQKPGSLQAAPRRLDSPSSFAPTPPHVRSKRLFICFLFP